MRKMKNIVLILLMILAELSFACSPIEPSVEAPSTPYGEFKYTYPPSHEEAFLSALKNAKDVAVFKANLVWGGKDSPREYAEIELLHGWGHQRGSLKKLTRENYFCGEFVHMKEGRWYVGLMKDGLPIDVLAYERAKNMLAIRGEAEYVFTAVGLLR